MNDTPTEKICTGCKVVKPLNEFHNYKAGKYGVTSQCKACRKATWTARGDKNKAYREVYYQENKHRWNSSPTPYKGYDAAAYAANCEVRKVYSAAYRARKANAEGSYTAKEWLAKLKLYKGRCHWCHKKITGATHADHVIALSKGGTNYISNIVPACAKCNVNKNAKSPLEFAGRLF